MVAGFNVAVWIRELAAQIFVSGGLTDSHVQLLHARVQLLQCSCKLLLGATSVQIITGVGRSPLLPSFFFLLPFSLFHFSFEMTTDYCCELKQINACRSQNGSRQLAPSEIDLDPNRTKKVRRLQA